MFPAIMPWPMTLAPTNEAVRHENCAKKTLIQKLINPHDPGVHERCKDRIAIREAYNFVRVGERLIELMVLLYIFCLIYRMSSVDGCTLWILSCSVLVPH
jgi:hypothetical protein